MELLALSKCAILFGWFRRTGAIVITDPVFRALLLGFGLLAILDGSHVAASFHFTFSAFLEILPFLVLAITLAAMIKATGSDQLIAGAFSGHPGRSIVLASLAGTLSPFCSCGVVPLIATLLRSRVPLAPVMAFWIASPIMDPEMFVLTAAGIGILFALAKVLATFLMGMMAGVLIHLFRGHSSFERPLRTAVNDCCSTSPEEAKIVWTFWSLPSRKHLFIEEFRSTGWFLGKWLLLAFFLESLMVAYVPASWIAGTLGSGAWYEIPLAALVGIPAYLNGYAAVPLVSGLLDMGMNNGAALAFMTAGAVSSIPAAMAVYVLVKRAVFVAYLLLGFVGATLTGILYAVF